MSLWSSLGDVVTTIWRGAKTLGRWLQKGIFGLLMRLLNGFLELFLFWVPKKFRIQVFILRDETKIELVSPERLDAAIESTKEIFNREFNVRVKFYGLPGVQILSNAAPTAALDILCNDGALGQEFGEAGEYFADHQAGWAGTPTSIGFPVSVFIVRSIVDNHGCAKDYTDYVWIAVPGITSSTLLAHELGHTCLLNHRDGQGNLMYKPYNRGTSTTWWQRRVVRTSRHCTFW